MKLKKEPKITENQSSQFNQHSRPAQAAQSAPTSDALAAEYLADLQRTRADFENFRKQSEAERERARQHGAESTVLKFLPLLDDMDRAFQSAPDALAPIRKSFEKTLASLQLSKIDASAGTAFNPDLHDAISMDDTDGDVEIIAEELRPGYAYEGQVIRAAMVRVTHAPDPSKSDSSGSSEIKSKISAIKRWLGTGSINIFGLPLSGKDTAGTQLATDLGAAFLSSGDIIRTYEKETGIDYTGQGALAPTDVFYKVVLPYFTRPELAASPLVLSSIGRWSGEENEIMSATAEAGHPIKAVIKLDLSEDAILARWQDATQKVQDRGYRADDATREILDKRIREYQTKTLPVLDHYAELGLLITVAADDTRETVYQRLIDALYAYIKKGENHA